MVPNMENAKKNISSKNNNKKVLLNDQVKRKLLIAGIIAAVVIICGGYFTYMTGVPAKILAGATVAGQEIKVNEFNYQYFQVYNSYINYGSITKETNLDSVMNTTTGQTYREFIYDQTAQKLQKMILLNDAAKKDGFKPVTVERQIKGFVASARSYAKTKKQTADQILKSRYGAGSTVRDVEQFMRRELTAQEYTAYLMQTKYSLTTDEMTAMYTKSPSDYENATFHFYIFPGSSDATATDADKKAALDAAKKLAQGVVDTTTDAKSFRDASAKAAGAAAATQFADNADPTLYSNITKATISASNTDLSDFLFSADRKPGDTTVLTSESGAYAVYFESRQLDETPSVSYRSLILDSAAPLGATADKVQAAVDKATAKANEYKTQITDENSFIGLVKKYSDINSAFSGGLVSGVTAASLVSDTETDETKALSAWLFAADRKPGDMIIIPGTDTVTLYYFQQSLPAWQETIFEGNVSTQFDTWFKGLAAEAGNGYSINVGNLKFATY